MAKGKRKSKGGGDSSSEEAKLEIAPMIDVTFLLLIFFMCAIKFKVLEGKLDSYLPKDVGVQTTRVEIQDEPIRVTLRVKDRQTVIYVGSIKVEALDIPGKKSDEETLKIVRTLPKLERKVRGIHTQAPELKCVIDPDEKVPNGHVVAALDACMRAGISDINFTIPPKKKKKKKS